MKTRELDVNRVYCMTSPTDHNHYIFKHISDASGHFIRNGSKYNSWGSFGEEYDWVAASPDEEAHLLACIEAKKFAPNPKTLTYEIY